MDEKLLYGSRELKIRAAPSGDPSLLNIRFLTGAFTHTLRAVQHFGEAHEQARASDDPAVPDCDVITHRPGLPSGEAWAMFPEGQPPTPEAVTYLVEQGLGAISKTAIPPAPVVTSGE